MRELAAYRCLVRGVLAPPLILGLIAADVPTARAQEPAAPAQVEGPASQGQIAVEKPRRPRRPPRDPAVRELRQTRGMLAGGIALTAICGASFGLSIYVIADAGRRLQGASGSRVFSFSGAMLGCMVLSIGAIGVSGKRLRTLERPRRVAWSGGLGLRF